MSVNETFATIHHFGQKSQFKFYSIGYAAENKPLGTKRLKVNPSEILPYVDGEVKEMPTPYVYSGTLPENGGSYAGQVITDMVIDCEWLAHNSNRYTAPDVRRGERILIYVYGDSDKYYWVTTGFDDYLRKLETATWVFSDTQDENYKTLTPENTYSFEVSTHKGLITLQTAKSNKEPYKYIEQLNAKEGEYHFTDDINNYCFLKSKEHYWKHRNASNAYRELIQGRVYTNAPVHYRLTSGPTFIYADNSCIEGEAPDHITWDTGGCSYGGGGSAGGYESTAKDHVDIAVDNRWRNPYNALSHRQEHSKGSAEDSRYGTSTAYGSVKQNNLMKAAMASSSAWSNDQAHTRIYANNSLISLKTVDYIRENVEGKTTTEKSTSYIKTNTPDNFLSTVGSNSFIDQKTSGTSINVNSGKHDVTANNTSLKVSDGSASLTTSDGTGLTESNNNINLSTSGGASVNMSGNVLRLSGDIYIAPWGMLFRTKIEALESRMDSLEAQLDSMNSRISSLSSSVSNLKSSVSSLSSRLTAVEGKV